MKTKSTSIQVSFIVLAIAGSLVLGVTDGLAQLDFGDAPDAPGGPATGNPYPTLLVHDGARHAATGPILGAARDIEGDGQPNTPATGDDIAGATPDDEDGVFFPTALVPGSAANPVTVTTSGAGPYILNAWMDFNGDGDWADAGEQIFTNTPLVLGPNALTFTVPAGTLPDQVYSRWRLNTTGSLNYDGATLDGEVEDYCHGSIHGQKWHDRNSDGKRDLTTEEGLNGYVIQLRDPDTNELATSVTTHSLDHDGTPGIDPYTERGVYWIRGVPPGFWIVAEQASPNAVQTFPKNCGADRYFIRVDCEPLGRTPPDQPPICGNEPNWVDVCPPGFDLMFSTAQVILQTPLGPPFNGEQLTTFAAGPTFIERFAPVPGTNSAFIPTEMLSMDLVGIHPQLGQFAIRAGQDLGLPQPSQGLIVEIDDNDPLALSDFDVFFEVEVPNLLPGNVLQPDITPTATAEPGITEVPPIGVDYIEEGPINLHIGSPGGPFSGYSIVQFVHKPIYGVDFANKITNTKKKRLKRKDIRKLKKEIREARKKGQRAKANRLTRKLNRCRRELKKLMSP